jgi:hypothetical protein
MQSETSEGTVTHTKVRLPAPAAPPDAMFTAKNFQKSVCRGGHTVWAETRADGSRHQVCAMHIHTCRLCYHSAGLQLVVDLQVPRLRLTFELYLGNMFLMVSLKAKLKACVGKYRMQLARLPRQSEMKPAYGFPKVSAIE